MTQEETADIRPARDARARVDHQVPVRGAQRQPPAQWSNWSAPAAIAYVAAARGVSWLRRG